MSTIKATLQPDPDGTLHLPLPPELRRGLLKITATVERVETGEKAAVNQALRGFGCLRGKIRLAADFDAPLDEFKYYME